MAIKDWSNSTQRIMNHTVGATLRHVLGRKWFHMIRAFGFIPDY